MRESEPTVSPEPQTPDDSRRAAWWERAVLLAVAAGAIWVAVGMYREYLRDTEAYWRILCHDRHGHFAYGLDLGMSLRRGDVLGFVKHLGKSQVWPPVHGLAVAGVTLVTGADRRTAVLPSLAGWVLLVVGVFLLARQVCADRVAGTLGGLMAAGWALASPMHQSFAVQTMLESLGAALSVWALWLYVRALDRRTAWAWRWWALAMTGLFFEKYNYWGLLAAGLACHQCLRHRRALAAAWRHVWREGRLGRALAREFRQPLTILALALVGVVIWLGLRGPTAVCVFGRRVGLYPPYNILTVAFALAFARVLLGLRRFDRRWWRRLPQAGRQAWWWHALPVALSFLLPRRLGMFLWFAGPSNKGFAPQYNPLAGLQQYGRFVWRDYHVAPWSVCLAAAGCVLAAVGWRRLRDGARAVLLTVLVGVAMVSVHPYKQGRFLITLMGAFWALAGVGWATAWATWRPAWARRPRLALGAAFAAVLVGAHAVSLPASADRAHALAQGGWPVLTLSEAYLPKLADTSRGAIFSTLPDVPLARWTFIERYPQRPAHRALEFPLADRQPSVDVASRRFAAWLKGTTADAVVLIDIPTSSPLWSPGLRDGRIRQHLVGLMRTQKVFRRVWQTRLAANGCTISLWRRAPRPATRPRS